MPVANAAGFHNNKKIYTENNQMKMVKIIIKKLSDNNQPLDKNDILKNKIKINFSLFYKYVKNVKSTYYLALSN